MSIIGNNIPPGPTLHGGTKFTRKKRPTKSKIWPKNSIVYICGKDHIQFDPSDKDLGGSEQAVTQLSKRWASMGYSVIVFGNVKESTVDGVEYCSIYKLNILDTYNIAIFWRSFGIRFLPLIQSKLRIVDLHDSWCPLEYIPKKQLLKLTDIFMLKSNYHRSLYDFIPDSKVKIVMNGIQTDIIKCSKQTSREPYRLIYTSSYDRGIEPLLKYTWPRIKAAIPDAEFHIYYGMNRLKDTPLGKRLAKLFLKPGVHEHGRVSLEEIAKEKCKSAINLYISNSETEIDCISVRESLICGAVPVIGTDYVFKERDGVHITGSTDDPNTYKKAAKTVIDLLTDQDELEKRRRELYKSNTLVSWETVANKWISIIDG